jgi:hypothetical protein
LPGTALLVPGPGPLRRVIATGLATGLLGALVLTLVVFAGAGRREPSFRGFVAE